MTAKEWTKEYPFLKERSVSLINQYRSKISTDIKSINKMKEWIEEEKYKLELDTYEDKEIVAKDIEMCKGTIDIIETCISNNKKKLREEEKFLKRRFGGVVK